MIIPYKNKRIIIAPLCWGLGHASRCIPIIVKLLEQNNTVAIASDNEALRLLQGEFPSLESFTLPAYDIHYTTRSMMLNMIFQAPKITAAIRREGQYAQKLAVSWNADVLISDNRLGFKAPTTKNIYITHQLKVLGNDKLQTWAATFAHQYCYNKFDECWIPDYNGPKNLAGILSQYQTSIPTTYLGPISRLVYEDLNKDIDTLIILSGPEPQRTIIEKDLISILTKIPEYRISLVRGSVDDIDTEMIPDHITVYDFLNSTVLNNLINRSKKVVCRSGYSSIMDMVSLNKQAVIIPTPGQTEQEYLAKILDERYGFTTILQKDIKSTLLSKI